MEPQITKDMTIADMLKKYPNKSQLLAQVLSKAGLMCGGCKAATWETLEDGMLGHGMQPEQITNIVKQLNDILEQEYDTDTVTLTPKAAIKFKAVLLDEKKEGWGMRFSETTAGCDGFQYVLDFSEQATDKDTIFISEGIEIHVDKGLVARLVGSVIDYVDGLQGAGFKISNPHSKSSCGCGSSHGY